MIIIRLTGGLGNQLFEHALGRRLELVNGANVRYDTTWFEPSTGDHVRREFGLERMGLQVARAGRKEILRTRLGPPLRQLLHGIHPRLAPDRSFREQGTRFLPEVLRIRNNAYLDGYWQSEKYFADVADHIRTEFTPPLPAGLPESGLIERMATSSSISLHVRRGDYIGHAAAAAHFVTLDNAYYERAVAHLTARVPDARFFVFTDDPQWVRQHLHIDAAHELVPHRADRPVHIDLLMMTRCRHHVIANSSFSWWGAWLNGRPDKEVVAPLRWYKDDRIGTGDPVPSAWTRL